MSTSDIKPRAQLIVRCLTGDESAAALLDSVKEHARVPNLPSMVQRHGLLQVATFLQAKGAPKKNRSAAVTDTEKVEQSQREKDEKLRKLLERAMQAVLPGVSLQPAALAKLDLSQSMFQNELALEAATWIARLADAALANGRQGA